MRPSRGFTLIELIIAVSVLAIVIGTAVSVLGDILNSTVQPEILDTSTHLAEREMERISFMRFSQVANAGPANFTSPFSNYSYQVTVSPVPAALANDPGMAGYKQVQVTVTHLAASPVSLTTIVTRNS